MIPILYIMTHQRNPLKKLKPKLYLLRSIQRTADTRRGIKTRMFILVCRKGRPLFFNDQSTKRFKNWNRNSIYYWATQRTVYARRPWMVSDYIWLKKWVLCCPEIFCQHYEIEFGNSFNGSFKKPSDSSWHLITTDVSCFTLNSKYEQNIEWF